MKHKGLRYNSGKPRFDLVQPWAHEEMVKVLTVGANKYEDRNWEKGMKWTTVLASLKRHISAIENGEDFDEETGLLHAAHVACNAHFLTAYYKIYPQGDDRPHKYLNTIKIGLDLDGVIVDFVKGFYEWFNEPIEDVLFWNSPFIRKNYDLVKMNSNFWLSLPRRIEPNDLNFEPHCYITSRSIDNEITREWLLSNGFPDVPVYSVGHDESKVEVAKSSGIDIYVDDRYENFIELNREGICTFLMTASYNLKYDVGFKRINNLSELL